MANQFGFFGRSGNLTSSHPGGSNPLADDERRIERALSWILGVFLFGFLLIAVIAMGQAPPLRWPFFGTATLAALAALAVGVALGLLFGLPIRTQTHVVTTPATPASPGTAPDTAGATAPQPTGSQSWYTDNTSLEQIAQWLTTAIVALTLVNFDGWMDRFETTAQSLTCAMYQQGVQIPIPATGASRRQGDTPVVVLFSPCSVACAPQSDPAAQGGRGQARPQPAAQANCTNASPIPGGVIIAMYALFGFIGAYLWARRYLMGEFSRSIVDESRIRSTSEQRLLDRAKAVDLLQSGPKSTSSPEQINALTETVVSANDPMSGVSVVQPGSYKDDPWKLQFGGQPYNKQVTMSATVTELVSRPGLYQVNIEVRPSDDAVGARLANRPVRIYLHPTFPNPVRTSHFDVSGRLHIPLIAYGAFTVGIQLEDDEKAELDLSSLPDAPMPFRKA